MNLTPTTGELDEELSALHALTANMSWRDRRIVRRILSAVYSMNETDGPMKTAAALDAAIRVNGAQAASQAPLQIYLT